MQDATRNISGHPLGILRSAQRVAVQESFFRRYAQPVETAAPPGVAINIENGADFAWLEIAYASDRKTGKIDKYLCVRNRHVAGDGLGR